MASTTKIMTSLVIMENFNLSDVVEISKKAANTGGSRLGLKAGDKITVSDSRICETFGEKETTVINENDFNTNK